MANRPQRRPGFTLAEALLAATVLAMTVVALTVPFSAAARNDYQNGRYTLACCLAQELMEEVIALPFRDPDGATAPGPESGETSRSLFDNIDDYDGYAEAAGEIVNSEGSTVTGASATGLSRLVSVTYVYVVGQDGSEEPTFVRVVVEVRDHGQPRVKLTRLVHAAD
jgi:hypothetical protein